MKKADLFFNVSRLPVDFLMLILAGVTTYLLRTKILSSFRPVLFEFNLPLSQYVYLVLIVSVLFIFAYAISGLYSMKEKMTRVEELSKIMVASSAGIMLVIIFIFLRQELFNSRFLVLGGYLLAIIFVFIGRQMVRLIQEHAVSKYAFGIHRVLIIGDDEAGKNIAQSIKNNPGQGYRLIDCLSEAPINKISDYLNLGLDEVILTKTEYGTDKVLELIDFCHEHHIIFKFIPNTYQTLTTNFNIDIIDNYPIVELKRTPMDGWGKVAKRLVDISLGILGLIIFLPLFGLVAFLIKWETEGPVFVKLKRISKNREFGLIKFRSMVANAEELKPMLAVFNERNDGPLFKMKDDPRVTGVGRVIRKYRVDELPQFWNILKGDISLVGPRPHQPDEISHYKKYHKKVLAIKAGATGLAQVSGSSDLPFDQEVALDSFYIENWSLFLDFKIIMKTVLKMLRDKSAV
jgi:exopolysaccharide biosynthesis polyprenyl glycosylphosphotransferase